MNPLILCVDCEFSKESLKYMVEDLSLPVSEKDLSGRTALHYACDLENEDIIVFLLEHGADPKAKDNNGSTPEEESEIVKNWLTK